MQYIVTVTYHSGASVAITYDSALETIGDLGLRIAAAEAEDTVSSWLITPQAVVDKINYQAEFTSLYQDMGACEFPEGSQPDDVLIKHNATYSAVMEDS